MGQKNLRGTVTIFNDSGRLRLRWRYNGERFSFSTAAYTKASLLQAKRIALTIEEDIREKRFDSTLVKYKQQEQQVSNAKVAHDTISCAGSANEVSIQPIINQNADTKEDHVAWFEKWTKDICNMDCEVNKNYNTIRNMLKRWDYFEAKDIIDKFRNTELNNRTYNRRLTTLIKFYDWTVRVGYLPVNPLQFVQRKRVEKTKKSTRKPFTIDEISRILHAFEHDTYTPASSGYKHSHYYPFVYFIFKTGVRNAEAIGLRVKTINLDKKTILINEVLARTLKGANAAARVRKETKNGKERFLPLSADLQQLLEPLIAGKDKDELVFKSCTGVAIDDKMFQKRIFKKVLRELKIEERVLYACRHTFGSRCLNEGITPIMTAFLMGNNPETLLRTYTHQLELPKNLPSI